MAMLSFRADDADVVAAEQWARRLDIDRSELLRNALRRHLIALAADHDVQAYREQPLTDDENAFASVADWADWADAAR